MLAERDKDVAALYDPARQTLSPAALTELRMTLVGQLLQRACAARPTRYARSAATIETLPVLTGAELADEVEAHPPFGRLQLAPGALIRAGLADAGLPRPTPIAGPAHGGAAAPRDACRLDAPGSRPRGAARRARPATRRVGTARPQLGHPRWRT